ncbi:MAG: Hsp20 family protein [Candidatus Heimdallarchaeota archaeon]|nr:Hsp20 family protein [Candidatus Heimdallarchaeota archaeon]
MEQFSRRSSGRVFQKVIDNTLHVYFALPGVDKEKIKIRAKPDTMIVEARPADQFAAVLGDKNISLRIKLNEEIDPNELSATYTDGILITTAPTSNQYQVLDVD